MHNKIRLALFGALCYNITAGLSFAIVRLQANALGDFRTLGLVVGLPNFALVAGSTFWGVVADTGSIDNFSINQIMDQISTLE